MTRGRNKALVARRDEALCRRYHYWTEIKRRRFDDTLKILSEKEFFLSEERILDILRSNGHRLCEIARTVPPPTGRFARSSFFPGDRYP